MEIFTRINGQTESWINKAMSLADADIDTLYIQLDDEVRNLNSLLDLSDKLDCNIRIVDEKPENVLEVTIVEEELFPRHDEVAEETEEEKMEIFIRMKGSTEEWVKEARKLNLDYIDKISVIIDKKNRVLNPVLDWINDIDCVVELTSEVPQDVPEVIINVKDVSDEVINIVNEEGNVVRKDENMLPSKKNIGRQGIFTELLL